MTRVLLTFSCIILSLCISNHNHAFGVVDYPDLTSEAAKRQTMIGGVGAQFVQQGCVPGLSPTTTTPQFSCVASVLATTPAGDRRMHHIKTGITTVTFDQGDGIYSLIVDWSITRDLPGWDRAAGFPRKHYHFQTPRTGVIPDGTQEVAVVTVLGGAITSVSAAGNTLAKPLSDTMARVSVTQMGAVCDAVTDDTGAFQRTIERVRTTKEAIYVPRSPQGGCRINGNLVATGPGFVGLTFIGDNPIDAALLGGSGTAPLLTIGDGTNGVDYLRIDGVGFQSGAGHTGWLVDINFAPNLTIVGSSFSGENNVRIRESWQWLFENNIMGVRSGIGLRVTNASFSGHIHKTRCDGVDETQGVCYSILQRNVIGIGNIAETVQTGWLIGGGSLEFRMNYIERAARGFDQIPGTFINGLIIGTSLFEVYALAEFAIRLRNAAGVLIEPQEFAKLIPTDWFSEGAAIIATNEGNTLWTVYDSGRDANDELIQLPENFADLDFNLLWINKGSSNRNLIEGSFTSPPDDTGGAPTFWRPFVASPTFVAADGPFADGSIEITNAGATAGVQGRYQSQISPAVNAAYRGRYVIFTMWARSVNLAAPSARFQLDFGTVSATSNTFLTNAWACYAVGARIPMDATQIEFNVFNTTDTATERFANPGFFIDRTLPICATETPLSDRQLFLNAEREVLTGTTTQTAIHTLTLPAFESGAGSRYLVEVSGFFTGVAGTKAVTLSIGPTNIITLSGTAAQQPAWKIMAEIIFTSLNTQEIDVVTVRNDGGNNQVGTIATTVSGGAPVAIAVAGQLSVATDTITVAATRIQRR